MLKSQGAPLSPAANILYPQGKKKVFPSFIIGEEMGDRGSAEHLALSPSTPILLLAKGDEEKERGGGGGRGCEEKKGKNLLPVTWRRALSRVAPKSTKASLGTQTHPRLFSIFQPTPSGPGVLGSRNTHTHALTHACTHAHTRAEPLRLPPPPPPRPLPPPLSPPPLRLFCLRSLFPRPLTESAAKRGSKKFHSVQEISSPGKTSEN